MKAFLFDLDGTLLNTIDDITDSVNYIMEKYGYPTYPVSTIIQYVGNGLRRLLILCVPGGEENPDFEKMYQDFVPYYAEHSLIKTKPYDGILPVLEELQRREVKMAIITNKNVAAANRLNQLLFERYIPLIMGEDEAHGIKKKPNPDMVLAAMKELDVSKEECIYIGDSDVDILTARNASIPCIAVGWGFRTREQQQEAGGKYFVDKPEELLNYVTKSSSDM